MVEVVTIANFENSIEANLAKQDLEAEAIAAFLADEITVNIAWHLTVAVRWIKLQVPEPDVERALSVLAEAETFNASTPSNWIERLPQTALNPAQAAEFDSASDFNEYEGRIRISWTDEIVERLFRAAVFGLLFLPIQLYSLWLLVRLLVSLRIPSQRNWWKIVVAIFINFPMLWIIVLIWQLLNLS